MPRMIRILLGFLAVLFANACLKPSLESLDFQGVSMDTPVLGAELGTLILSGDADGAQNQLVNQGFLMSENLSDLEMNKGDTITAALGTGLDFQVTLIDLDLEKLYYIKAWAEYKDENVDGNRIVYSSTYPFSFSIHLGVFDSTVVTNNSARLVGFVTGQAGQFAGAMQHGFVYSASPDDELVVGASGTDTIQLGAWSPGDDFMGEITGLQFNTAYYFKSWAISSTGKYYISEERGQFRINGGWVKIGEDLNGDFLHGFGEVFDGSAYLLGCEGALTSSCADPGYDQHLWKLTPDIDNNAFEVEMTSTTIGILPRHNAVSFVTGETMYIGTGEEFNTQSLSTLFDFLKIQKSDIGAQDFEFVPTPPDFSRRTGAFAFMIDGKSYIGGGADNDEANYLNDCWEFDPATGTWTEMAPLPMRESPVALPEYNKGRREALAFSVNGNGYVGGGVKGQLILKDFWRFTKPSQQNPSGAWEFFSFFPGPGRVDAVSFEINNKGYFGTGFNFVEGLLNDFWEFNPGNPAGAFAKIPPFPGKAREDAFGFAIAGNGYVGMGISKKVGSNEITIEPCHDIWRYIPHQ